MKEKIQELTDLEKMLFVQIYMSYRNPSDLSRIHTESAIICTLSEIALLRDIVEKL